MLIIRRLILAGVLAAAGAAGLGYWYVDDWRRQPLVAADLVLELQPGDTLNQVVGELAAAAQHGSRPLGRLDRRLLIMLGQLQGAAARLQVGEYLIKTGTTPSQLLQQLQQGRVIQHEFRIAEGATVAHTLAQLRAEVRLSHQLQATGPQELCAELEVQETFCEGWFFPDTYNFRKGSTDAEILQRAHAAMKEQLAAAWSRRHGDLPLSSDTDLLVLASIIEKESALAGDRETISQVFHNRLRKGMRLQTDPTVIYGIGAAFDGNLTRKHLRTDTAFNTYTRHGLPPTPIALPSRESLLAAARPSQGNFLYFVSRGDGTSQFSETLAEHNAAVRRYQLRSSG